MNNDTAAIIVTYNRKDQLCDCIECLMQQTAPCREIVVIDNASTDGTLKALSPYIENGEIRYENTGQNLGGAGGFQYGIRIAAGLGCDYIWIMDDDSMPMKTALEALLNAAQSIGNFGYLSGKTLWTDGSLCRMNIQRDVKMKSITDFSGRIIPSGAATFVSLLVPIRVVQEIGLPIRDFFIWSDDLEYTRRISRKYPCYVVTGSITIHNCATNNGGNISTDLPSRIDRYRYAYRNEVFLYRREGLRGIIHLALRTPLHILRVLVKSDCLKLARIRIILGGTVRGLCFHPEIEYLQDPESPGSGSLRDVRT